MRPNLIIVPRPLNLSLEGGDRIHRGGVQSYDFVRNTRGEGDHLV